MPNNAPLVNGDYPYPEYIVVKTMPISANLAIVKGQIYTVDANGNLIEPVSTSSVADCHTGIYQAMDNVAANVTAGASSVQCLTNRSRIILKAATAGMVPGQEVELDSSLTVTTPDTCMVAVQPHTLGFLGRIIEIYTPGTNGATKQLTAVGDLVIIDLGEG